MRASPPRSRCCARGSSGRATRSPLTREPGGTAARPADPRPGAARRPRLAARPRRCCSPPTRPTTSRPSLRPALAAAGIVRHRPLHRLLGGLPGGGSRPGRSEIHELDDVGGRRSGSRPHGHRRRLGAGGPPSPGDGARPARVRGRRLPRGGPGPLPGDGPGTPSATSSSTARCIPSRSTAACSSDSLRRGAARERLARRHRPGRRRGHAPAGGAGPRRHDPRVAPHGLRALVGRSPHVPSPAPSSARSTGAATAASAARRSTGPTPTSTSSPPRGCRSRSSRPVSSPRCRRCGPRWVRGGSSSSRTPTG